MSNFELEFALKVIRNECMKHDKCDSCPLRNERNECYITYGNDVPENWKLIHDSEENPDRVFK